MAATRYFFPIRQALEAPSLQETLSSRDTGVDVGKTPMKTLARDGRVLPVRMRSESGYVCSICRDTTLGRFAADLGELSNH